MTDQDLTKTAELLEHQIESADAEDRLKLQPEFSRVLERLTAERKKVPSRLRRLEAALTDEAVEAQFNNMPV